MTIAIIVNVLVFICLGVINPEYKANTSHHYQYYRLAEAMLDGHFYLNDTPPASLIMLDNPYDPDMRRTAVNNNGESFKWDTAYRNGKYYVYLWYCALPYVLLAFKGYGVLSCQISIS